MIGTIIANSTAAEPASERCWRSIAVTSFSSQGLLRQRDRVNIGQVQAGVFASVGCEVAGAGEVHGLGHDHRARGSGVTAEIDRFRWRVDRAGNLCAGATTESVDVLAAA